MVRQFVYGALNLDWHKCATAPFKCIIKTDVAIFLLFRKNKETKRISM